MPTSLISDVSLVNLGALTTTFTLPTGCRDNTDYQILAATDFPQRPVFVKQCDPSDILTIGNCLPDGEKLDEYVKENRNRHYTAIFYHSPGNVCPQGWNTVGVAQKDDNGSLSVEGIFDATEFPYTGGEVMTKPPFQPRPNYLASALDDSETAIYCCPSDLTADPLDGGCKGTTAVESYTESTGCALGYEWPGGSATDEVYTYNDIVATEFKPILPSTVSITISVLQSVELVASRTQSPGEIDVTRTEFATSEFVGYTDVPAVILVNKGEEPEAGEGEDEGEGEGGDEPTESGGTGNDNGSAASGRSSLMWEGGCMMAVFWGVCLLL